METPVGLFIFRRPETTERVFATIRGARPKTLLVISDGARTNNEEDAERVSRTRAVVSKVDWPCEVKLNFSDHNMGCKRRVSSGLDWVFGQVERAIILEDDCLPHPSFFSFCEELLEKYANNPRIMHISGDNFQPGRRTPNSYYFSRYPHVWGWASWRRAWKAYDVGLQGFDRLGRDVLRQIFSSTAEQSYWHSVLTNVVNGKIDTWDYQWAYACLKSDSLSIVPEVNLISNIGFGAESTHTRDASPLANLPVFAMDEPMLHPSSIEWNREADAFTFNHHFGGDEIAEDMKLRNRMRRSLGALTRYVLPR